MPDEYKPRRPRRVTRPPPLTSPSHPADPPDLGEAPELETPPEPTKYLPRLAASQSFSEVEVEWLMQLITILLRGGDARMLMRAPEANRILFKLQAMKDRIEVVKKERMAIMKERETI